MKKKIFSYISLASLIVPSFFVPIVNVRSDEQQESVAQATNEESENMSNSSTTLDSSTTQSILAKIRGIAKLKMRRQVKVLQIHLRLQ